MSVDADTRFKILATVALGDDECADADLIRTCGVDPLGNPEQLAKRATAVLDAEGFEPFERPRPDWSADPKHHAPIEIGVRPKRRVGGGVQLRATVDSIELRRVTDTDADTSHLTDPDRYSDVSDAEAKRYREADRDRLRDYEAGQWEFLGVFAVAKVRFFLSTHPGGSGGGFEVSSPGLWGVESDSDPAYLAEIEREQRGEIADTLAALGLRIGGELTDAQALDALSIDVSAGTGSGADHAAALYEALEKTGRRVESDGEREERQ